MLFTTVQELIWSGPQQIQRIWCIDHKYHCGLGLVIRPRGDIVSDKVYVISIS